MVEESSDSDSEEILGLADEEENEEDVVEEEIFHDDACSIDEENEGTTTDENDFYLGKNMVTKWSKTVIAPTSRTRRQNIVFHRPGPAGNAKTAVTPIQCFECLFDDAIVSTITLCTNIYIQEKVTNKYERERDAKFTNECEIRSINEIERIIKKKKKK